MLHVLLSVETVCCGQLVSMSNHIEREVVRRAFVVERWNLREKEKLECEAEAKKKAGVSIFFYFTRCCYLPLNFD